MNSKIFKSVFITSMIVLAVTFLMIFSVLFNYFEGRVFEELKSEAKYISYGITYTGEDILTSFEDDKKRITLISPDGAVLADTKADVESLENHSDRKEFKEALKNGTGRSARYSDTLTEKTLYYALKLSDGSILRVSTTQNSVAAVLLGLVQPIILIVAIALAISLFLSYKVSNSIIEPINSLDLENPSINKTYEELTPLLKKISLQKKTIKTQIEEAEKSREEFKLICENMNEGFLVIDKKAMVLSHNSAALRLLKADNVKDSSVLSLNRTKNFRSVIEKVLRGEHSESILSDASSSYSIIANPVYQSDEVLGAVIVIIDVTESEKREQLRREFTSNVSHELKTPLTSISGFAEMMKSESIPADMVKDFSASIYSEAQRLISLVSDIMKISELDEGAVLLKKEKLDVYSLVSETVERLKPISTAQNIKLNVHGNTAYIMGAGGIIGEMIYNLCDNAIKYNIPSGKADITVVSDSDNVKLIVEDTGIGIPQTELSRVFERFYRVDKSRSKSAGGTGLGLAIVKHGALYHDAKIDIESTEGKGTKITLSFVNADKI